MLYQTVNERDFIRAFDDVGRSNQFSPLARKVLFEYLSEISEMVQGGVELDPIGICCEWGEYTLDEIVREFGYMVDREQDWDDEEYLSEIIEYMSYEGTLLVVDHVAADTTYLFSE